MSKSPSRATKAKNLEEDASVLKAIKEQPELFEGFLVAGTRKQQLANLEEASKDVAKKINVSADTVKRIWLKTRVEAKKVAAAAAAVTSETTRPRSARSNSSEPREARRSVRLQSVEKADSIASATNTDNSCASSLAGDIAAGDPPTLSISSQQQQLQTFPRLTRRTLQVIRENNDFAAAAADSASKQQKQHVVVADGDEKKVTSSCKDDNDVDDQLDEHVGVDERVIAAATADSNQVTKDADGATRNAETTTTPSLAEPRQTRPLRYSEQTPRRRASLANKMNRQQKPPPPSPEDSTRVFFESMGLAVMCFPQHVQATVKSQVSSIVLDLEYELNSPSEAAAPVA